jgi:hypothetical protein
MLALYLREKFYAMHSRISALTLLLKKSTNGKIANNQRGLNSQLIANSPVEKAAPYIELPKSMQGAGVK